MSSVNSQGLRRFTVAGIPLITATAQRLGLRAILSDYVGAYGNESIPVVDTLMILLCNLALLKPSMTIVSRELWTNSISRIVPL